MRNFANCHRSSANESTMERGRDNRSLDTKSNVRKTLELARNDDDL